MEEYLLESLANESIQAAILDEDGLPTTILPKIQNLGSKSLRFDLVIAKVSEKMVWLTQKNTHSLRIL